MVCGYARTKISSTVSGHSPTRGSSATVASPRRVTRTPSSLLTVLSFPSSYDREALPSFPPSARVLHYLTKLREEPPSDEGSSADEGAPPAEAGWRDSGNPMMIGSRNTSREFFYDQSLASSSRWVPHARKYHMDFTHRVGTTSLLMELTLDRV